MQCVLLRFIRRPLPPAFEVVGKAEFGAVHAVAVKQALLGVGLDVELRARNRVHKLFSALIIEQGLAGGKTQRIRQPRHGGRVSAHNNRVAVLVKPGISALI